MGAGVSTPLSAQHRQAAMTIGTQQIIIFRALPEPCMGYYLVVYKQPFIVFYDASNDL